MPVQLKGFTAWISVESAELASYNVETTDDGKKVTCWVPSEAGKASWHFITAGVGLMLFCYQKFEVLWTMPRRGNSAELSGRVTVDGMMCGGKMMGSNSRKVIFCKRGFSTSPTTVKPFTFGELKLTGRRIDSKSNF